MHVFDSKLTSPIENKPDMSMELNDFLDTYKGMAKLIYANEEDQAKISAYLKKHPAAKHF